MALYNSMEEEYASQSKLLQEFTSVSSIDGAWVFKNSNGKIPRFSSIAVSNPHFDFLRNYIKLVKSGPCFMTACDRSTTMFSISQKNLLANNTRKHILHFHIMGHGTTPVDWQWSPFPTEMTGVSAVVPSPSVLKLLVVRNGEKGSSTKLEILDPSHMEKEIHVDKSIHGPLFTDEWFQGISWNHDETFIAYIADESP